MKNNPPTQNKNSRPFSPSLSLTQLHIIFRSGCVLTESPRFALKKFRFSSGINFSHFGKNEGNFLFSFQMKNNIGQDLHHPSPNTFVCVITFRPPPLLLQLFVFLSLLHLNSSRIVKMPLLIISQTEATKNAFWVACTMA
jgi:hypothetical protein